MSCSLSAKFLAFSCFICIFWRLLPTWENPVRSLQGKAELNSHTHLMLTLLSCPTGIRRNPWESLSSGSCFCLGWLLQRQAGLTHLPSMQPHNRLFRGREFISFCEVALDLWAAGASIEQTVAEYSTVAIQASGRLPVKHLELS